uniref:Uncharacterized protein n=1 Tax=mine drainage metagenome TaxID=410659 RepID=E6Q6R5_9ZZZZ
MAAVGCFASGHPPCFNGAATLSSRKSRWGLGDSSSEEGLQWGRDVIVAEMLGYKTAETVIK